ncbi:MAG: hypothetical protein M1825_001513 [Sarcosagium campestre]|nr:MAG: hypothetical protein M1825_001513 [Sarcosagium campestre]
MSLRNLVQSPLKTLPLRAISAPFLRRNTVPLQQRSYATPKRSPTVRKSESAARRFPPGSARTLSPADALPPAHILEAAERSGALSLSSAQALVFLTQYIELGPQPSPKEVETLCREHSIKLKDVTTFGQLLYRAGQAGQQQNLGRSLVFSASALTDPSATFFIVQQALREEDSSHLSRPHIKSVLCHLENLANVNYLPLALLLHGKVLEREGQDVKAFDLYFTGTLNCEAEAQHPGTFEFADKATHAALLTAIGSLHLKKAELSAQTLSTGPEQTPATLTGPAAIKAAEKAFRKAASLGDPNASYKLSRLLSVHLDHSTRYNSSERNSDISSNSISSNISDAQDEQKLHLLKAASMGVIEAAQDLGMLYLNRAGHNSTTVTKDHLGEENRLGKKSDHSKKNENVNEKGSKKNVVARHHTDEANAASGLNEDIAMAKEWFTLAATAGLAPSMLQLAMILKRTGKTEDAEDGLRWLEKAGEQSRYRTEARRLMELWQIDR